MPRSGSYAPKADKFRKVRMMTVQTRSGDKTEEFNLTPDATGGEVKIKAVRGTGKGEKIIEGEIDVTQGDRVIKGSFAATVVGTK